MEPSLNFLAYLAGVSLRSLSVAVIAGVCVLVFRIQAPASRHAVWTMVMMGMLLTALNPWLGSFNLPLLPAEAPAARFVDREISQPLSKTVAPRSHPLGEDGSVESVTVIKGNPVLAAAAEASVREWKYQPTAINGQPVKVVTTVEIPFRLN